MRFTTSNGDEICIRRTFHATEHGGFNYDSLFLVSHSSNNQQHAQCGQPQFKKTNKHAAFTVTNPFKQLN